MENTLILASNLNKTASQILPLLPKRARDLKAVRIPTAANPDNNPVWLQKETRALAKLGFNFADCDIEGKSAAEVRAALVDADVIYVTGGNTYYLLAHMKKCGFEQIIRDCLNRGAIYIGCSAGAVVACTRIDFIADMDDPNIVDSKDYNGLGLVPFLVLPHLDHPHYASAAQKIAAEHKSAELLMGLNDNQIVQVKGSRISFYQSTILSFVRIPPQLRQIFGR